MTDKPTAARSAWLDETSSVPIITEKAQQMKSFLDAMADGVVDASEVKAQEARLVELMKQIEPLLSDELHEKITQLLCEVSVYDLMHVLHTVHQSRPQAVFRG